MGCAKSDPAGAAQRFGPRGTRTPHGSHPRCPGRPRIFLDGAKSVEAIRTILGVPILKGDELLGVIMIYRLEVRPFTDTQIGLVETFADQAAIAIENVRLFDEVQARTTALGRSVEELRALSEVSQAINSTLRSAYRARHYRRQGGPTFRHRSGAQSTCGTSGRSFSCARPTA